MKSVSIADLQQLLIDYHSEVEAAFISSDGFRLRRHLKRSFGIRFNDAVVQIPVSGDSYALIMDLLHKLLELEDS